nr:condensation domain-containing protein [Kibdelosporangium sp. MJ126-NF4]CEL12857.1 Non-ribosomal peptide synthetase [Kibdelosporangium sp. MJ126-NF4]CTQ98543.1 Non-ribosomal peptide synthetase [Kibdelosporangium sp. MJ126-NF4]
MTARSSSELSAEARRLLEQRLSGRSTSAVAAGSHDSAPLSSDQRRLWFLTELRADRLEYNVDAAWRLRGPLRPDALEEALRAVVRRHDVLRITVSGADAEPRQVVGPMPRTVLARHDLAGEADPVAAAFALAQDVGNQPFDLTEGPLLRAWLARLGPDDHVFGVTVHHMVFDRDSLAILLADIAAAYAHNGELDPLPAQYTDFAAWQRQRAQAPERAADRDYWRERLADVPVVLELPTDRPRPPQPSGHAGEVAITIPPAKADAVRALAAAHRTTPFIPALAAFQGVLSRYAPGVPAVAVGCPFNARTRVEFEGLIGFFARSLPVVADIDGDPTFARLVDMARDTMLTAHRHQELPLDEIVALTGTPRDLGHNPVFQVWFDLADTGDTVPWPDGVSIAPLPTGQARTRFDVEMHLVDNASAGITGRLLYATDLFDHETAVEFARHYETFLAAAVTEPSTRLSRIPLLAPGEAATIIGEWSVS